MAELGAMSTAATARVSPDLPGPAGLREIWLYANTDCNLSCCHCLLPEHSTRPPLDRLLERARQALALGVRTIFITGGEPFVRRDLVSLLAVVGPRCRTVVLTNGTLVDAGRLRELDRVGAARWKQNLSFQVSLDGLREAHEAIRGPRTFEPALNGVRSLIEWGRPPTLATAVTRLNLDDVAKVTELAGSLGLKAHHLFFPHLSGRLAARPELVPSALELLDVVRRCRRVADRAGVILDNDRALAARVDRPGCRFEGCNGGREMIAVAADGAVYPCPSLIGDGAVGDSQAGSIAEAWAGAGLARFRAHSVDSRDECRRCDVRSFCGGGCAAYSFWTGGDFGAEEPYCAVYRGIIEDHLAAAARPAVAVPAVGAGGGASPDSLPERFSCN